MKRLIVFILILAFAASLAGCGAKKSLTEKVEDAAAEKAAEAIAEKALEKSAGGDADVDIDGENAAIKGEDGSVLTVGESEWPKSELAKSVPEFKSGKITGAYDSENYIMVTLEEVEKADADAYLEKIKEDFDQEATENTADDYFSYGAKNEDGLNLLLLYSDSTLTLTITKES